MQKGYARLSDFIYIYIYIDLFEMVWQICFSLRDIIS